MTGSLSNRIREFHGGKTYTGTKASHGKAVADKQAVAAALHSIGDIYRAIKKKKKR